MLSLIEEKKISNFIIGIDEVGRGPLAGPVVSAAVILPENFDISELNDSKKILKSKREMIFETIKKHCCYKIGIANVEEIDRYNILQATFLSMKRAIQQFELPLTYKIIVDGPFSFDKNNKNIIPKIKGDTFYPSIAAASIMAKVYRDRLMSNLAKKYIYYSWEKNSGYGTKKHLDAIKRYGITKHHRKSFSPIHKILSPQNKQTQ